MENWLCFKTEVKTTDLLTTPEIDLVLSFCFLHRNDENMVIPPYSGLAWTIWKRGVTLSIQFFSAKMQKAKVKAYYYKKEK